MLMIYIIDMYIDFNKEINKKGPKVKVGNNVRISKHKNIFAKAYVSNWNKEAFKRYLKS